MFHAAVAELADAYRSGRYGDFSVQVRSLSAASRYFEYETEKAFRTLVKQRSRRFFNILFS